MNMVTKVINVSTAAQLQSALTSATGGETILLAAGNYGMLQLINGVTKFDVTHSAATPVTIRSADAARPAVFTGLDLRNTTGFTFEGVKFDYTYKAADQSWSTPFMISGGSDIKIRDSIFDGDVAVNRNSIDDGFGFATGFSARDTKNLTFENNTSYNFLRGASFNGIDNLAITGNDIHSMRSEGVNVIAVQGVRIEDNHIHDFRHSPTSSDHRDFIQFWTNGTKRPSTDIVIRNNLLDIGEGDYTQSIFMRNEEVDLGRAGSEMFYRNVLIEQNTIYNDHLHGISVGEAAGVVIRNNSVLHANGRTEDLTGSVSIPIISVATASTGVTISNNLTSVVSGGLQGGVTVPPGWTITNNLLVQDQIASAPNHYSTLFMATSLDKASGAHGFLAKPGSLIETMDIGADRTMIDRAPAVIRPQFDVTALDSDASTLVFDAIRTSFGPTGTLTPSQGTFVWDLGDGTVATGGVVQHQYARPGDYTVTLKFVQPNGNVTAVSETVEKLPLDLVRFDRTTGQFGIATDATGETLVAARTGAVIGAAGSRVIDLGSSGTTVSIARELIPGIFKADNFDLSLQIKADIGTNTWGEVFRLNGTFLGAVRNTGDFQFNVWTDIGTSVTLTSRGVNLLDGKAHDISVRYDADLGVIRLVVDGTFTTEAPLSAKLPAMGVHGLTIGNQWGGQNFNGSLSNFDLNVERSGYADYDGTIPPVPSNLTAPPPVDLGQITPLFEVSTLATDGAILVFDAASYSRGTYGPLTPDQGRFIWDFGDGTFAEGGVVQHRYATPGSYGVTLTFVQPNGNIALTSETVEKSSPDFVRFDRTTGQFGVATDTGETLLSARAGTVVGGTGAKMIDLGSSGATATISRTLLQDLFSADNFAIDLRIQADSTTPLWGEVFRLHSTFLGSVTRSGDFSFILWTDGSPSVTLVSKGVNLLDGKAHDISIRYDTDLGVLKLVVDGTSSTQASLSTNLPKTGLWDLTIGNPWSGQNFNGWLSNFDVNVERADHPDYTGSVAPISSELSALDPWELPAGVPGAAAFAARSVSPVDTYLLDATAMTALGRDQFTGSARVDTASGQTVLALAGQGDSVKLGLMEPFSDADQLTLTLDFKRASANSADSSLVANSGQVSLNILGDGFQLQVATATEGFKQYQIANLGLRDTDWHEAVVQFDPVADRLQVFLDDRLVFEDRTTDLVMTNPQGHASGGWTLGQNFAGSISGFEVVETLTHPVATGDVMVFS
jgi:PKD repeat protein